MNQTANNKKEDRRVRLTKLAIRESLIELMQKNPISKISVKMICEAADINRSTFYAHYTDQYDLLNKIQQEVVSAIMVQIFVKEFTQETEATVPVLTQILEYAEENKALFRVLLSENGDSSFQDELVLLAQQKSLQEIRERKHLNENMSRYLECFAVSGCLSIIRKWLDDDCPDEPEKLAELITKLLFQGISWFYR